MSDEWLKEGFAAIILKDYLIPVEGKHSPFFPPTFAGSGEDDSAYCIDTLSDGTRTCLVDTVGSQANRMEPIFMKEPYNNLIPQISIHTKIKTINLCEVSHRLADALIRNSKEFKNMIEPALTNLAKGDAVEIAKLAPTSLVFGLWDSRGTEVKMPRVVSSVIRAYNIDSLTRSAQYFIPVNYKDNNLLGEPENEKDGKIRSSWGFRDNPSTNKPGGIIAHGDIVRDSVINLAALRKITANKEADEIEIQKYILGLALVAATSKNFYLRQGCNLRLDPEHNTPQWNIIHTDGHSEMIELDHKSALEYAEHTAKIFGVGNDLDINFDLEKSKDELKLAKSKKK